MGAATGTTSPRTRHARHLFAALPTTYAPMGTILSFGQDPRWRRFMVSRLEVGDRARVLDVATGTGLVAEEIVRQTGASVIGLDQSEPMLREGVARSVQGGVSGPIRFVLGQAERLPFPDSAFDALTFTYLLRYVDDPATTLAELARVVRSGGTMASVEFHVPTNASWHALWWLYTRVGLPAVGRVASRAWFEAGRFLGPSISAFYRRHPLDDQLEMWRSAGVPEVRAHVMSLGGGVVIWGTKMAGTNDGG